MSRIAVRSVFPIQDFHGSSVIERESVSLDTVLYDALHAGDVSAFLDFVDDQLERDDRFVQLRHLGRQFVNLFLQIVQVVPDRTVAGR